MTSPRSASVVAREDEQLRLRVVEGKERANLHLRFLPSLVLAAQYVHVNALRDTRRTAIGVTTVFIVVTFVAVLYNAVLSSPLIFLRLAESQVGEIDMLITPYVQNFDPLLDLNKQTEVLSKFEFFNATKLDLELSDMPTVSGTTPRWLLRGKAASQNAPQGFIDTSILICDLEREAELNIGRGWPHRLLREGEAHVTNSLLYSLGVTPNEGRRLRVDIGFGKLLSTFGLDADYLEDLLLSSIRADNGVRIQLDGAQIARELGLRGIPVPPQVLPDIIETRIPVANLLDFRKLVKNSIQGAARGDLMALDVAVVDGIDSSYDKWPRIGNAILMEKQFFLRSVKEAANKVPLMQVLNLAALVNRSNGDYEEALLSLETPVSDQYFDRDMNDYAFAVMVQYKHRLSAYTQDANALLRDMAQFSNEVGRRLGFTSAMVITLPIFEALKPLRFLRIFLTQIFNSVTFVLMAHGSIVIYSLLLADAAARTYEYGMLRVMGLTHRSLILALVLQALYYAIPGVLLGLVASSALALPVVGTINAYAKVDGQLFLLPSAIATAATLGIAMPLISTLVPMRRALSRTLAESLNLYHKSASETTVNVQKLEDLGLSTSQTVVALILVLAGVVVFYLIPMSFIFEDFDLLFSALNLILMCTVIGLILLSVLLQPRVERFLVHCLVWGDDANLLDVVLKNLSSHYERSRKTSLIFCSSLAFIVFAGAMFSLQADSIVANLKVAFGSDLRIDSRTGALNEDALAALMNDEMARPSSERIVEDYAWASWPLWNVDPPVFRVWVSNLLNFPQWYLAETVAVSGNFLKVTYGEHFVAQSTDGCQGAECVRQMDIPYSEAIRSRVQSTLNALSGYALPEWCAFSPGFCDVLEASKENAEHSFVDALVPASLRLAIGAEVGTPLMLTLACQNEREKSSSRIRRYMNVQVVPKALVAKMPGYFFSSHELVASVSNPVIILGPSAYQRIFDVCADKAGVNATALGLPTRPPKRSLHVKIVPKVTQKQRIGLQNRVSALLDDNGVLTDTIMYAEIAASTVDMLMLFFYVLSGIAAVLCFFMLHINFEANVRDNLWEFGVLRALGVQSIQLIRIFIYESLSVILGAIIIGTSIGLALASVLTLQQNIFTEMPFRLVFPVCSCVIRVYFPHCYLTCGCLCVCRV